MNWNTTLTAGAIPIAGTIIARTPDKDRAIKKKPLLTIVCLILGAAFSLTFAGTVQAENWFFNTTSGDWLTAEHWRTADEPPFTGVPDEGDNAYIGYSPGAAIATCTLDSPATNNIFSVLIGDSNNTGSLYVEGGGTLAAEGQLFVGGGGNSTNATGTLTLNGVEANFGGNGQIGIGAGNSLGTVNLQNGAFLNFDGGLFLGDDVTDGGQASFSIDDSSQLNAAGSLAPIGGGDYYLPLASAPTNGKISFADSLLISYRPNTDAKLTIDSATSVSPLILTGELIVGGDGNATNSKGWLTLDGVTANFGGRGLIGIGAGTSKGTVNLRNGAVLSIGEELSLGDEGGTSDGEAEFIIDESSQLNVAGSLVIAGGSSYNLPLASTPTNGKISFAEGLAISHRLETRAALTIDSATSVSPLNLTGILIVGGHGNNTNSEGTLTLDGVTATFEGDGLIAVGFTIIGDVVVGNNDGKVFLQNGAALEINGKVDTRTAADSSTTVSGAGTFDVGGTFRQNGRIIADGGDLIVAFSTLVHDPGLSLMGDETQAGWYAENGGRLTLPALYVTEDVSWGENADDAIPELVNAMRLENWIDLSGFGDLDISLLAVDHPNVKSGLENPVGIWELSMCDSGLVFSSVDVVIRYDDVLAGVNEGDLRLLQYFGGAWQDLGGVVNQVDKTLTATGVEFAPVSQLAIATGFTPGATGALVCSGPNFACVGFEPPMANFPVSVRKNRALPLKLELFDEDGYPLLGGDITPPVVQVWYEYGTPAANDVTDDALPSGQSTEGNQFFFDSDGRWHYNLKTTNYSAPGTYTIFVDSGDVSEYVVAPTCETSFVIE